MEVFIKKRTHIINENVQILYNFLISHDNENGNTFDNVNKQLRTVFQWKTITKITVIY